MKKGFTLLELLGVIAILGLLVLICYPVVLEQVEKKQKEIDQVKLELIESAADAYIGEHPEEYPYRVGNHFCIPLDTLVEDNQVAVDVSDVKQRGVQIVMGSNHNIAYHLIDSCGDVLSDTQVPIVLASLNQKEINISLKDDTGIVGYAVTTSENNPNEWIVLDQLKEVELTWKVPSNGTYYVYAKDAFENIGFTTLGYIDVTDPTVAINVSGKNATLTLKDETELLGYAITDTESIPESWTDISGKEVSQTWTASVAGTYYAYAKDSVGNIGFSSFLIESSAFSYPAIETNGNYNATPVNANYNATATNANYNATSSNGNYNATSSNGNYNATATNANYNATSSNGDYTATATTTRCGGQIYTPYGGHYIHMCRKCGQSFANSQYANQSATSGANCGSHYQDHTVTVYSCPNGGTLSETTCLKTNYSCPNGGTLSGTTCVKTNYSCPNGGTLSGTTCLKTNYSCPSGGTLSGTTCVKTNYSCPSGGTLSGTTCLKTNYSCPNGGTLSGTTCVKTNYTCPNGGTLNGTTCVKTNYTCPNGGTLNGTTCVT